MERMVKRQNLVELALEYVYIMGGIFLMALILAENSFLQLISAEVGPIAVSVAFLLLLSEILTFTLLVTSTVWFSKGPAVAYLIFLGAAILVRSTVYSVISQIILIAYIVYTIACFAHKLSEVYYAWKGRATS
jgi:hypothetical protein